MALYKTHATFNIVVALPLLVGGMLYFFTPSMRHLVIFSGVFVYATLFMNPDLDLVNQVKLFSFRGLLTLPFRGYSRVFSHRGISHSLFFGTLTRILWLGALLYLVLFLLGRQLPDKRVLFALFRNQNFLFGLSAIVIADLCHLLLDLKEA